MKYNIFWKDHKLERGPVNDIDARSIVSFHLKNFPDDPIWLIPETDIKKFEVSKENNNEH